MSSVSPLPQLAAPVPASSATRVPAPNTPQANAMMFHMMGRNRKKYHFAAIREIQKEKLANGQITQEKVNGRPSFKPVPGKFVPIEQQDLIARMQKLMAEEKSSAPPSQRQGPPVSNLPPALQQALRQAPPAPAQIPIEQLKISDESSEEEDEESSSSEEEENEEKELEEDEEESSSSDSDIKK